MTGSINDVIVALQAAARQAGVYPAGHPARAAAFANAHARLAAFLAGSGGLTLGVARDALLQGDKRLDSPAARALARSLFRREVALLTIEERVSGAEVELLLQSIADRPGAMESPPLADELKAAGVAGISVRAVDYATLAATSEVSGAGSKPLGSLWESILHALVEGRHLSSEALEIPSEAYSGAGVAALFAGETGAQRPSADAASLEILDASVATHLARATGALRPAAVRQMAELFLALPAELRERLLLTALRALAVDDADADSLRELAARIGPDAVLKGLRRLSSEGLHLSSHALRLVQTLMAASQDARRDGERGESPAEARQIVAELVTLFQDEDVDRFNPEDHQALLESASALDPASLAVPNAGASDLGERADSLTEPALEQALTAALFELLANREENPAEPALLQLRRLFQGAIRAGQLERATSMVGAIRKLEVDAALPAATRRALSEFLANLAGAELLTSLLLLPPKAGGDVAKVKDLIARLGSAATLALLEALASEQDQSRRRRLFNLIASLGSVIVPDATRMLKDGRWYVVRNMIALLRKVGDKNSLPEVRKCTGSSDLRVRLEAIKTLLTFDPKVPRELLDKAILDPDPKLAEPAVVLVGQYAIQEAKDPLVSILLHWDLFGAKRSLRLKTLRALADLGDPAVLPRLGRFFRDGLLPPVALEERRAAFRSLEAYPAESRRPLVERGLKSRDPLIRDVCQRLAKSPAPPPLAERTLVPSAPDPEQGP